MLCQIIIVTLQCQKEQESNFLSTVDRFAKECNNKFIHVEKLAFREIAQRGGGDIHRLLECSSVSGILNTQKVDNYQTANKEQKQVWLPSVYIDSKLFCYLPRTCKKIANNKLT